MRTGTNLHQELIDKTVDAVWSQYDKDGNGFLDKEECKAFIKDSLHELGQDANGVDVLDEAYEAAFKEYDADGTGSISKGEMAAYLKKLCGFE